MTLFDAVALVGGSAVGGGFLAIPDVTAPLGFLPSTVGLTLTWAYFVFAGLAYVEAAGAASGEGRGASILALSRHAFGKKRATFISFIFLAQVSFSPSLSPSPNLSPNPSPNLSPNLSPSPDWPRPQPQPQPQSQSHTSLTSFIPLASRRCSPSPRPTSSRPRSSQASAGRPQP